MSMTVTARISKLNTVESVEWDLLPETSRAYLAQYGFTQALNDAHASVQRKNFSGDDADQAYLAAVKAKVEAKLKGIEDGSLRAVVVAPPSRDAAIKALANSMNITIEQVEALLAASVATKRAKA